MNRKTTAVETDTASAKKTARRKVAVLKSSLTRIKHKAGTANGTNEPGIARQVELAPQLADMDIDQVRPRHKAIMPNVLQQHRAGHSLAGMPHEIFQQLELGRQ